MLFGLVLTICLLTAATVCNGFNTPTKRIVGNAIVRVSNVPYRCNTASVSMSSTTKLEAKSFLRNMLSSRTKIEVKSELYNEVRNLRPQKMGGGVSTLRWNIFMDSLISEMQSVSSNKWAMKRWPIPLPSYRVKLGALNRMWKKLSEQERELVSQSGAAQTERETQRRALGVLLGQLRSTAGVRALENEMLRRSKRENSMKEMLDRTPKGLETPSYKVIDAKPQWEVRQYDNFAVCSKDMPNASTAAATESEKAPAAKQGTSGGQAFNELAGYIFGKNQQQEKMAMTTPVITSGSRSRMSFVMPSRFWGADTALATAPLPVEGSGVQLTADGGGLLQQLLSVQQQTPDASTVTATASTVAVKWFGGYANRAEAENKANELRTAIEADGTYEVVPSSESYFLMQYNDPFVPPWKRRNEVAIPVKKASA